MSALSSEIRDAAERVRKNLDRVRAELHSACEQAGRDDAEVTLLPVTKYADTDYVRYLFEAGLRDFGESTVQETQRKEALLSDLSPRHWHLIGHLQKNKIRKALGIYDSIESIDSPELAVAIDQRWDRTRSLRFLLEVNTSGEATKKGFAPGETLDALRRIQSDTELGPALVGLMTIGRRVPDAEDTRECFQALRELRDKAIALELLPEKAELSMGMSNDFQVAVAEGATLIRIGSRLFEGLPMRKKG